MKTQNLAITKRKLSSLATIRMDADYFWRWAKGTDKEKMVPTFPQISEDDIHAIEDFIKMMWSSFHILSLQHHEHRFRIVRKQSNRQYEQ